MNVKPEVKAILKDVEAIVFDIDGVLIDVNASFRKTIAATLQFYFQEILKYSGDEELVKQEEITLFKDAGGFNNDWELTESLALFYLAKAVRLDSKELAVIRYQEPFLDGFVVAGVGNFEKAVLDLLDDDEKKAVLGLWNKGLVRQIFQEMYAGGKYCRKFYGFEPVYFRSKGTINREVALLDPDLISKPAAVITGRAFEEAEAAIDFVSLDVPEELVVCDDGRFKRKPDPEALAYISDKMKTKLGLYIGDVWDDYQMVANFNGLGNGKRFLSAIITDSGERFKEADIIAADVNEILRTVTNG